MAKAFAPSALTCLRQRTRQHSLGILSARQYHSHEHASSSPFSPSENAILSAALKHVPNSSFTAESLSLGAQDAGYLPISTNLFPSGTFALVNYHLVTQRLRLSNSFSRPNPSSQPRLSDHVRLIAMQRLRGTAPYIPQWQDALALLSMPSNISTGVRELARLADEILYLAGSDTVTTAWYTDRMALAGIYASAELFMTQDRSREFSDTEDFLHRRLQEGEKLRDVGSMVGKWVGMQAGGLIDGLRSKGVWI